MALASWLRLPKLNLRSAVTKTRRPQRQTTRPRLEMLEDRMLLSAAGSANQMGPVNNPTLINFNTPTTSQLVSNGPNGAPTTFIANGQPVNLLNPVTVTALANQFAQGLQATQQFRALGVNSQGQGNFDFLALQMTFLTTATGFGSGTWPNRPWVPAAYNLGLANHQFGYPSQSDLGFLSAPPWANPTNQQNVENRPLDEDATWIPEHLLINKSAKDQKDRLLDKQNDDESESPIAPAEKPKPQEQSRPELKRAEPQGQDAFFTEYEQMLETIARANRLAEPVDSTLKGRRLLTPSESSEATPLENSTGIPSSLWLSTLAPAQLAALVTGLPAVQAPAEPAEAASTPSGE